MARILVGVTGGISAYKAVELVRLLGKAGHSVRVVQTPASERFVGRATFEGITSAPVASPAPLVVAPAMNDRMWSHPATEANVAALEERGAVIVPPTTGSLA